MNVSFLLKEYFHDSDNVSIDGFDAQSLNDVYQQVLKTLTSHFEIEVSVLQALSYCFYEILDNVHIHSGKPLGTAITHFDAKKDVLRVLVADDGIGIRASLAANEQYKDVTESDAIQMCLKDSVTDGKGMGFGLYATSRLMKDIGIRFVIHSGHHKLIIKDNESEIIENGLWQGTIIFMEITTSREIDPNDVVEHRTEADEQYNEQFIETEELENLWKDLPAQNRFKFSEYGTDFGTRDMGAKLRQLIQPLLVSGERLALDFTDVNVVSNSFADECIAKLLQEYSLDALKQQTTFCNLKPMAERSILVALQRRNNSQR